MKTVVRIGRPGDRRERGFTLVELAAALAILSILIALAFPRYLGNRRAAYKDEGYQILQELKTLEWSYYQEHTVFTGVLGNTGFTMPGGSHWAAPTLQVPSGSGNNGNGQGNGNGNGSCNNGNGQGNGNGNGNGNGQGNGNGNGQGNGNCNGNGNTGAAISVVLTIAGAVSPLGSSDQISLTLGDDGSVTSGSTF
ncbi:MAG TPA: type II secretion system protein [bacterium]|nr:type II secretion system protein [bacterium]